MLLFAERSIDGGLSAFAGQAAAVPGSEAEREGTAARIEHTEIFPLTLFAVGGMMLFAASNDLLILFVALEVFSLPLYLLCGLARRRRLISQEAAMKYFLLGAFSSAFLLFGIALLYGYAGTMSLGGIADALASDTGSDTHPARRHRPAGCRPAVQGRRAYRSTPGRRTCTRALRRRSPDSWRPAPRSPRSSA